MGLKIETYTNPDHIWFTSDTHFGHTKIIECCNRPFATIEEMNDAFIANWNERVQPDDVIFHLGDFGWGRSDDWNYALQRLNGKKHLIIGNHDEANLRPGYEEYFESITYQKRIEINGRTVYMNHFPFMTYGGVYRIGDRGVWQLHGHVHSGERNKTGRDLPLLKNRSPYQYDVGVDNNNYAPISFAEIAKKIEQQTNEYNGKDVHEIEWFK